MARRIQTLFALVVFLTLPLTALAQESTIEGTVEDAQNGETLPGVQVFIPALNTGAVTNADGVYRITGVQPGTYTLEARFVGFRTTEREVEVPAGETVTVDFQLRESAINLNEVVVTGTGGPVEKRKLGNTISTINAQSLESMPVQNFSELLQGREPGVAGLPSGGLASEGARIRIRGSASLSQSNEPLVYIDGIRANNGGGFGGFVGTGGGGSPSRLDDINPLSIARVEVLKGAAAATLFGTQASNGVLQIFTKQGKIGPPRFNFVITQAASVFPDAYPDQTGFASSQAQADNMSEVLGRDVQPFQLVSQNIARELTDGTGQVQSYAGSISGGAEGIRYYVSARFEDNDSPFQSSFIRSPDYPSSISPLANDAVTRYQGSARVDITPSEDLSFRVTSAYSDNRIQSLQSNNNIYGISSLAQFSKPELVIPPGGARTNRSGTFAFATVNESLMQSVEQQAKRFNGSVNVNLKPIDMLELDTKSGVDFTDAENTEFRPFGWNIDGFATDTPDGERSFADVNNLEVTLDTRANLTNQIGEQFESTFTGGIQGFVSRGTLESGNGFDFPGPGFEVTDAAATTSVVEQFSEVINGGIFGQEQLGYNDYLFLTVGARYDANSAFGSDFDGVLYPKASVSFIPSDSPFWTENSPVSSLKVRAAVGNSGLQPGAFDALTTFSALSSVSGPGVVPNNLGNPELEPEVSTEWEVGLDMGLFEDRLGIEATYWDRTVNDALVQRQFPVTGGFRATQLANIGQTKAQGVELSLDAALLDRENVSVDLFANTAYLYEEVTDLGDAPPIKVGGSYRRYRNYLVEGYAPGTHFGVQLMDTPPGTLPVDLNGDGQADSEEFLIQFLSSLTPADLAGPLPGSTAMPSSIAEGGRPGVLIAQRSAEACAGGANPECPTGAQTDFYLGKPTPDFSGSFGLDVGFLGNFQVSTLFEYKFGNYYVNNLTDAFRNSNPIIGRNTPQATRAQINYRTGGQDANGNPQNSGEVRLEALRTWLNDLLALDPFSGLNTIESADFLRWRELSLTYNVPRSFTQRFNVRTLSLTVAGRNLALISGYGGVDPELNAVGRGGGATNLENQFLDGVEAFGFPIPRRFEFRMRLGF